MIAVAYLLIGAISVVLFRVLSSAYFGPIKTFLLLYSNNMDFRF